MGKRVVWLRTENPILDIASYGREGPGHPRLLTPAEIAHVSRTVQRVPEVMVRVTGGAHTLRGVATHVNYIEKHAELETDDGVIHEEKGFARELLKDWDLDLQGRRRHAQRGIAAGRRPGKLVHNIIFSMPAGTPAKKVHQAVKTFALEKFALQHRYAMALHTHQGNPHVHLVVKAVSEQGERLNIRRATLREWRRDFARYLRELGVQANATERAVRGSRREHHRNGKYWAHRRGDSWVMREREASVEREVSAGKLRAERGREKMVQTRADVREGWRRFAELLARDGIKGFSQQARQFGGELPSVQTAREQIAAEIVRQRAHRSQAPPMLTR